LRHTDALDLPPRLRLGHHVMGAERAHSMPLSGPTRPHVFLLRAVSPRMVESIRGRGARDVGRRRVWTINRER
jgi:hypothetical protein